MRRALLVLLGVVWAACACAAGDVVEGLTVLPPVWDARVRGMVSEQDEARLWALSRCEPNELDALLASDDPREVGVGVFVVSARGDLHRMLRLDRQVEDGRPTLPRPVRDRAYAIMPERTLEPPEPQTVAGLTESVLLDWFGLRVADGEGLRRAREEIADPEALVRPWVVRLRMSLNDRREAGADVLARIVSLPEPLRWAVLADAAAVGVLSERDAAPYLRALSSEMKRAIARREPLLPDDPLFKDQPEVREALMRLTERVLQETE